jgi:adenosylhomocysteine nucleosidase
MEMKISSLLAQVAVSISFTLFADTSVLANPAEPLDTVPRTAVISAFQPEWTTLQAALQGRKDFAVNGTTFATGTIGGKPVVLFLSGISMVNASMTTQLALDRFNIDKIVFSGIAGGADPALTIGDVAVPEEWAQYLESVFARQTGSGYTPPSFADHAVANFNMIFPQPVSITKPNGTRENKSWFQVDPQLLAVARKATDGIALKDCVDGKCLPHKPKVVIGGHGVSGSAFVDNKAFRQYAHQTFGAEVIDMESAAVAQVAYVNQVPFIAFRSLSDLAGGSASGNEMETFFQLASDNSATVVEAFLKALP